MILPKNSWTTTSWDYKNKQTQQKTNSDTNSHLMIAELFFEHFKLKGFPVARSKFCLFSVVKLLNTDFIPYLVRYQ